MNDRILMSSPDVGELEEKAILSAIRSGWIAPLGPDVDAFEEAVANRVGARFGVALSSGTAALHLGLLSLGVGPGDVVVTSTMTFAATANAIVYTGAEPFFVDCLPETGNMDPELLRSAIKRLLSQGKTVGAVLPVDLLGKTADYTRISMIAEEFGIPILADAAESLGASHAGKPAGCLGKASAFSFNGNKIMTTSGGGMLMTDDAHLAKRVRHLATQARQPVVHYEHEEIGYNYRLSNLLAALGRAQLSRLDEMIEKRRAIRRRYKDLVSKIDGVHVFGSENDELDNCWLTALSIDKRISGFSGEDLAKELNSKRIESRPLWKPMHLQPVFSNCSGAINGTAEGIFRTHITLPSGSALSEEQIDTVIGTISSFTKKKHHHA